MQNDRKKILFTGGNGLLGTEFKLQAPEISYTDVEEFDITNFNMMRSFIEGSEFKTIIHAAAFTSPPKVDGDPIQAIDINIIGTSNIVKLCNMFGLRLIYLSTDYVFDGKTGNYNEDDSVNPVNKYAVSKLGGECAVRLYDNALIIRTSFGPNVFPFEKAFVDQWTSRESVRTIASKILKLADSDIKGIIHIGGERRTVLEYAKSVSPDKNIGNLSVNDVSFVVPKDTSLDCSKYKSLFNDN